MRQPVSDRQKTRTLAPVLLSNLTASPGSDKSPGGKRDYYIVHSFENIEFILLGMPPWSPDVIYMNLINVYLEITRR